MAEPIRLSHGYVRASTCTTGRHRSCAVPVQHPVGQEQHQAVVLRLHVYWRREGRIQAQVAAVLGAPVGVQVQDGGQAAAVDRLLAVHVDGEAGAVACGGSTGLAGVIGCGATVCRMRAAFAAV